MTIRTLFQALVIGLITCAAIPVATAVGRTADSIAPINRIEGLV
ncbi:MAG TPA: hypothetical protein VE135_28420 [Pyrinomonadaceae bacterium]|nr:hypothetical protein [Pyrinomonadaceae bacterium]